MTWPFEKPNPDASNAETPKETPKEKTAAELIAESLKPFGDTLSAINSRLDAFEQANKRPEPRTEPTELPSVFDDENAAFNSRMTPVVLRQLEIEARMVRDDIRREYDRDGYGDLWNQYENEINAVLTGSPVVSGDGKALRGSPDYIRNVVDMVFGKAARKAGMRFDGKKQGFFLESAAGGTENTSQPVNDGFTNDQRKVISRMKIPVEDAKKTMAKLKFVSV